MEAMCNVEIIEIILSHLDDPFDLLRCSVVSQRWHSAYLKAQTSALNFSLRCTAGSRRQYVSGLVRWIQARHAEDNFCQLASLTADFYVEDSGNAEVDAGVSETLWFSAGAVLMLAGAWPLERVAFSGRFDFNTALELLPASVQHLQLSVHSRALLRIVDLATFCKFGALKSLTIVLHVSEASHQRRCCFSLSATLTNLTSLNLSTWPLLVKNGCSVAQCLPSLLCATLHVHVGSVNAFTCLEKVKALYVHLMDDSPLPPAKTAKTISVESSSQLRKLVLRGPLQTDIRLLVGKPGMQLDCKDINVSCIILKYPTEEFG